MLHSLYDELYIWPGNSRHGMARSYHHINVGSIQTNIQHELLHDPTFLQDPCSTMVVPPRQSLRNYAWFR
jgi:hypothetical protein